MGKKRNQQTSYLRGLLIKKLVTRTGIESSYRLFLCFEKLPKTPILRHLQAFGLFRFDADNRYFLY